MTVFFNILIFFAAFLLETTKATDFIAIFGIMPNLLFLCLICFTIYYGKERGIVAAVITGLLLDCADGMLLGGHALIFLYSCILCSVVYETIFEKNIFTTLVTVFGLSLLYNLVLYFVTLFLQGEYRVFYILWRYILPNCLYNTLLSPLIYWLIGKVYYKNERIF